MARHVLAALVCLLLLTGSGSLYVARAQKQEGLPKVIAGLPFAGAKKFEDPRLGLGITYEKEGASLTLLIYSAGHKEIPQGIDSALLREQFEQSKADIQEGVRQGIWSKASLEREGVVQLGSHEPTISAREAVFELSKGDIVLRSYIYMTAGNNSLFKVRYTVLRSGGEFKGPSPETVAKEIGDMLSSWISR